MSLAPKQNGPQQAFLFVGRGGGRERYLQLGGRCIGGPCLSGCPGTSFHVESGQLPKLAGFAEASGNPKP